ncbi:MAG: endonuclease [Verrucomicrobia bacterium]|nr:endonuclease [Verrucomicrobiota bacterium]MCH8511383.1 endonuclease [Kiritimatiellia bacterium]
MSAKNKSANRYSAIMERIFFSKYTKGAEEIVFERDDLITASTALGIHLPKNLGDVIYSFRYRNKLPENILNTEPPDKEWVIEGQGKSMYAFRLVAESHIVPNKRLAEVKIPDATPEIVSMYAFSDEQALLAKVRYNRLLDIFLGLATYSLQNHLRTTVKSVGQVEIDEIYIGVDKRGCHYVLPVQAKGGTDQLSMVQTKQDLACCREKFPDLICRAISAQFLDSNVIVLFELTLEGSEIKIVEEKHYRLVPGDQIQAKELLKYANRSKQ